MMTMLPIRTVAEKVVDGILATGGATVSMRDGSTPNVGYGIAVKGHEKVVHSYSNRDVLRAVVARYIEREHQYLSNSGLRYVGAWIDSQTDTLYLDITRVTDDREQALFVAEQTGEKAIWDFAYSEEIRLQD